MAAKFFDAQIFPGRSNNCFVVSHFSLNGGGQKKRFFLFGSIIRIIINPSEKRDDFLKVSDFQKWLSIGDFALRQVKRKTPPNS